MDTSDQIASENYNRFMRVVALAAKISVRATLVTAKQLHKSINGWYQRIHSAHKTHDENLRYLELMRIKLEGTLLSEVSKGNLKETEFECIKDMLDANFRNFSDEFDLAAKMGYAETVIDQIRLDKSDIYQILYDNEQPIKEYLDKTSILPTKEEAQLTRDEREAKWINDYIDKHPHPDRNKSKDRTDRNERSKSKGFEDELDRATKKAKEAAREAAKNPKAPKKSKKFEFDLER